MTVSVGLPAKINNPLPATQARFHQLRVINRFLSKAATSAVIVGNSSNDLEFLLTLHWKRQCGHFQLCANWSTLFHVFLVTVEDGASQVV